MVEIKNNSLKLYIETIFNKTIKDITKEELEEIEVLSYTNEDDLDNNEIDLSDIVIFPNVKKVVVSDGLVSRKNIVFMRDANITEVRFNRCAFHEDLNLSLLPSIKSLELIGCYNESFEFLKSMTNLNFLAIVNPYLDVPVDITNLSFMKDLIDVSLQRTHIKNDSYFSECAQVKTLNLLGTNTSSDIVSHLNKMSNLSLLFVDNNVSLDGLKSSVEVKHNFIDFLFDEEEVDEPTLTIHL